MATLHLFCLTLCERLPLHCLSRSCTVDPSSGAVRRDTVRRGSSAHCTAVPLHCGAQDDVHTGGPGPCQPRQWPRAAVCHWYVVACRHAAEYKQRHDMGLLVFVSLPHGQPVRALRSFANWRCGTCQLCEQVLRSLCSSAPALFCGSETRQVERTRVQVRCIMHSGAWLIITRAR